MLIRLGEKHAIIRSQTLTWIQVLGRTTAEVLRYALRWMSSVSPAADDFQFKVRVAIADKASENDRCEHGMLQDRQAGWSSIRVFCHVHVCSTAHTKTFSLVDSLITGSIHYSLSLSLGNDMQSFRKS